MNRLKEMIARWLGNEWIFNWLKINQPEAMRAQIKEMADKTASEVAMKVTMACLDQAGMLHCSACPTRFELRRVPLDDKEIYLCAKHYQVWNRPTMAAAAQGGSI